MIPIFLAVAAQTQWWSARVEASIDRAPDHKEQWVQYLNSVPPDYRASVGYLMDDLPYSDLVSLPPEKLTDDVRLALKVKREVRWEKAIPDDVFDDAVLPHACVGEPRDSMRKEFHDRYLSLAKAARSPGEAALALNKVLFRDYKVKYDTKRRRTDQSPKESISQGMATCTGLSIMLVDACRAIGIPARMAGIESWPGRGGNHTWVEVWDGSWHFVGAAEPDAQGLDHAWFVADAAKAIKSRPMNAIYAVTYCQTGDYFPSAWDSDARFNGVNVTDRYTRPTLAASVRLMVDVTWHGERVAAMTDIRDSFSGARLGRGSTLAQGADINHFLAITVPPERSVVVKVNFQGHTAEKTVQIDEDTIVRFDLP